VLTLDHDELAILNAEHVRATVSATTYDSDIYKPIREHQARDISLKGFPRPIHESLGV
jgi:hypothetical protein